MRQIKYEILKHINKFNVIFVSAMLVLNLAVIFFQYSEYLNPQTAIIRQAQNELLYDYLNNRERFDEEYADFRSRENEFRMRQMQLIFSDELDVFSDFAFVNQRIDLKRYGDIQLYRDVIAIINRSENFNRYINNVLREATSRIMEMGIEARGQFAYEYQLALILHYRDLAELNIRVENQYGWSEFFSLQIPVIFLLITFAGVFTNIFIVENRTKIVNILNICKNGGYKLIASKLFTIAIFSILLSLMFSLSPLIILNFTTGLSSASQYIQAVDMFLFVPHILTIWQYLFVFILIKTAVFLILALFIAILGQVLSNEIFVFSAVFIFLILNYLLSLVSVNSPFAFLRNFNFFYLAFVNVLFDRYRALNIFNFHVGFAVFVIALLFVCFSVLIIVSFALKLRDKDFVVLSVRTKSIIKLIKPHKRFYTVKIRDSEGTSILGFEFKKSLLNKLHIAILIAAIMTKIIIASIYFAPPMTNEERIFQNYIANLSGEITEFQSEFIREERDYINRVLAEMEPARNAFRDGEMTVEDFTGYRQRYNYARSVERPFERIEERYRHLALILNRPENFDNIQFIYDVGVSRYLFSFFDIVLVLSVIAMFANIFSNEYQSGFINILSISKNGGRKTFNAKYLFGVISITAMYIIFAVIDLIFLFSNFGMDYLKVGIMSIPDFMELGLNVSVFDYFLIFNIIRYFGFIALAMIIISLSNISGNVLKTALTTLFIIFVPFFLENFGVNILRFMNIVSILNPTFVTNYISNYIFYLVLCAALFFKSRFDWVKK